MINPEKNHTLKNKDWIREEILKISIHSLSLITMNYRVSAYQEEGGGTISFLKHAFGAKKYQDRPDRDYHLIWVRHIFMTSPDDSLKSSVFFLSNFNVKSQR